MFVILVSLCFLVWTIEYSVLGSSQPYLLRDNFNDYSELPTNNYDFKYGEFSLVDLGGGNKSIFQAKSYTSESYAMIPRGLVINSKNYEIIFKVRPAIWSGIGIAIGNKSTIWDNVHSSKHGNEFIEFSANGYSLAYPPFVGVWSRGYEPNHPIKPIGPFPEGIPKDLFTDRWHVRTIRYTGDIGSYRNWRWIKVVSNETRLNVFYGGMEDFPNWNYVMSIPHGDGNESPPYKVAFYWGNERGYIDDISIRLLPASSGYTELWFWLLVFIIGALIIIFILVTKKRRRIELKVKAG